MRENYYYTARVCLQLLINSMGAVMTALLIVDLYARHLI